MNKLLPIKSLLLIALFAFFVSCNTTGKKQEKVTDNKPATAIEVSITGMTCTGCENTIQTNVAKIAGIKSVKANAVSGKAVIEFNSAIADTALIRKAITDSGYGVSGFMPAIVTDSIK